MNKRSFFSTIKAFFTGLSKPEGYCLSKPDGHEGVFHRDDKGRITSLEARCVSDDLEYFKEPQLTKTYPSLPLPPKNEPDFVEYGHLFELQLKTFKDGSIKILDPDFSKPKRPYVKRAVKDNKTAEIKKEVKKLKAALKKPVKRAPKKPYKYDTSKYVITDTDVKRDIKTGRLTKKPVKKASVKGKKPEVVKRKPKA